jgi:hypothetical protein
VIADAGSDRAGIGKLRTAAQKLGATVHVIAPVGGVLSPGRQKQIVERTFLTVRSIELDARHRQQGVQCPAGRRLGLHRAWDRAIDVMGSRVPPAKPRRR